MRTALAQIKSQLGTIKTNTGNASSALQKMSVKIEAAEILKKKDGGE
jgi:hypothetical protein